MSWIRSHIFDVIAVLILLVFVSVWVAVLAQVWAYPPVDPATGVAPVGAPRLALSSGLVLAAGIVATTIGTQTAAALGYAVAEVSGRNSGAVTAQDVAQRLPVWTYIGVIVYLLVGLAIFLTWLVKESVAPEVVIAFALALVGWLIGAAGVVFRPTTR